MKTIICGGRGNILTPEDYGRLATLKNELPITELVCGMARGIDTCAYEWALENQVPVKKFYAYWNKYKKAAGPIRNSLMAEYAEVCIVFDGGNGTRDMLTKATLHKLVVIDLRRNKNDVK